MLDVDSSLPRWPAKRTPTEQVQMRDERASSTRRSGGYIAEQANFAKGDADTRTKARA